jgi:hypothetical protein
MLNIFEKHFFFHLKLLTKRMCLKDISLLVHQGLGDKKLVFLWLGYQVEDELNLICRR